ncbi:inframe stop codon [Pelomyxa schiedti]|nr:inframe stop codon [Pelomyxa schiedti]
MSAGSVLLETNHEDPNNHATSSLSNATTSYTPLSPSSSIMTPQQQILQQEQLRQQLQQLKPQLHASNALSPLSSPPPPPSLLTTTPDPVQSAQFQSPPQFTSPLTSPFSSSQMQMPQHPQPNSGPTVPIELLTSVPPPQPMLYPTSIMGLAGPQPDLSSTNTLKTSSPGFNSAPPRIDNSVPPHSANPEPLATPEMELRERRVVSRALTSEERSSRLFRAAAEKLPPSVAKYAEVAEKIFFQAATVVAFVLPFVTGFYGRIIRLYQKLPPNVAQMVFGLGVCLFGGHFAATLAVFEAFKQSGASSKLWSCVTDLYEAAQKVKTASDMDDKRDDNGDGIPDVDEIPAGQLLIRKTSLALKNVDPIKFNTAVQGLYQGFIAAVVVVQFKFAKTVALGNSLGDFLYRTVGSHVAPIINRYIPADYHGWVKLTIAYICKFVGISISWTLQFYQSVVQSAIHGSRIFSRALLKYIDPPPASASKPENKPTAESSDPNAPIFSTPINASAFAATSMLSPREDDTKIGEAIAWVMAFFGILFQYKLGFRIPLPINLVLMPLHLTEWSLKWSILFSARIMNSFLYWK